MEKKTVDNGPRRPRKSYKAYLDDNGENQPIVSTRTSNRWIVREETGLQYLSRVQSRKTETGTSQSSNTPPATRIENIGRSIDDETSATVREVPINWENESDHSDDTSEDNVDLNCSDNSDRCSSHISNTECLSESFDRVLDFQEAGSNDTGSSHGDNDFQSHGSLYENWIMFEASNISVWDVFNMVQAMSIRYKFSEEAQQSVLEFAKILAGPKFRKLNTSKYTMGQIYNPPDDKKAYVFFCPRCCKLLHEPIAKPNMTDNMSATCEQCSKNYILSRSLDNYFLTVDVAYQVRIILENPSVQRAINENIQRIQNQSSDEGTISDVYSSARYKNCDLYKTKVKNAIVLTLNVGIDGAPLFNSSKRSFWPIQAMINEIPAKLRSKFIILAALWVTNSEPKASLMNIYLKFFIQQITRIMNKGITIQNEEGETITYFVTIFCFPVDTPARAILQNRIQYNGYYGCSWCYVYGGYTQRAMKFLVTAEDTDDRSHEEFLKDIDTFETLRKGIKNPLRLSKRHITEFCRLSRGSKGVAELTSLPSFDCVWGFSCEYLHSVLLGAAKQQWEEWSRADTVAYLTPSQKAIIDERLISIKPPNEIHRLPRLLKDRAKWKGSEWKSWLLFYSVPCLVDVVPDTFLRSYMLLVRATHTLLRTDITEDDLLQSEIDLIQYVGDCQINYGEGFMTFNIHSLLHLTESVRRNGPLWATSAFPFESHIGQLKKVVTGPKGVVEQMANRMLQSNAFKTIVSVMSTDWESWQFCKRVYDNHSLLKNYYRTEEDAILAGIVRGGHDELTEMRFNRCIYKNVMYHSRSYTRPKTVNNRIVELTDNTILEIQHFSVIDDVCYLAGKILDTSSWNKGIELDHIRMVNNSVQKRIVIIPITEIKQKLVCLEIRNVVNTGNDVAFASNYPSIYVCIFPNTVEVQ